MPRPKQPRPAAAPAHCSPTRCPNPRSSWLSGPFAELPPGRYRPPQAKTRCTRRRAARPRPPYPSCRLRTLQRNRQPSRTRNPSGRPGAAERSPRYPWQGRSPGRTRGRSRERRRAQCCPQLWTSIPTMPCTHHGTPHLASRERCLLPPGRARPSPETPQRTGRKQGPRTERKPMRRWTICGRCLCDAFSCLPHNPTATCDKPPAENLYR